MTDCIVTDSSDDVLLSFFNAWGQCSKIYASNRIKLQHIITFFLQHDPETNECSPGGESGNYIMFARATSGDKPNNNKFSECSQVSMALVMEAKARHTAGCFIGKFCIFNTSVFHLNSLDF